MTSATVYIKPDCPFSIRAIQYLKQNRIPLKSQDVSKVGGIKSVVLKLKQDGFINKKLDVSTVPIVILDGKFIGGCSELLKMNF
jgi:glutaredoxin